MISVTVNNELKDEGTSIHWHGFLQSATPWYDGVPGVQQCPIAPGKSFTYTFRAELYGTSWWHAHYSSQYASGLEGPIVIYGPTDYLNSTTNYNKDLGPVMLSDTYYRPYEDIVADVMSKNEATVINAGTSDNNLINGKMDANCTLAASYGLKCTPNAGLSRFQFTKGQKYRLRLINSGAEGMQRFSIDGHSLTVIANDFVPIQPYTVDMVALGIGQRLDVVVTANGSATSSYWMRSSIFTDCSGARQPDALAIVQYSQASASVAPTSTPWPDTLPNCQLAETPLSQVHPVYPIAPPTPDLTLTYDVSFHTNASGNWLWWMNSTSARADYNSPDLLLAKLGNTSYPYNYNVNDNVKSVRVILNAQQSPALHPFHFHGHNMYELASGVGTWDGTITNPTNPARRDVHNVPAGGYYVMQYDANNPGVWPYHCHIAWHLSGGLDVQLTEHPQAITKLNIPSTLAQTCRDWAAFTNVDVVDEIDSGL